MPLGLLDERALRLPDRLADRVDLAAEPEPHVERDLVVPRAAGVELAAHGADLFDEAALDVHVDVFELDAVREDARLELLPHLGEAAEDRLELRLGEDAALGQRARPGLAPLDVLGPEPVVERQGGGEGAGRAIGGLGEAPAPRALRRRVGHRGTPAADAAPSAARSEAISSMIHPVTSARSPWVTRCRGVRNRRGLPKRTLSGTRRGTKKRRAARAWKGPEIAAGTTGTPDRSATSATPGWPRTSRPWRLNGPSGKMPTTPPCSRMRRARRMAPGSGRASETGIEPTWSWKYGWRGVARYTRGMTRKLIFRGRAEASTTPSR